MFVQTVGYPYLKIAGYKLGKTSSSPTLDIRVMSFCYLLTIVLTYGIAYVW